MRRQANNRRPSLNNAFLSYAMPYLYPEDPIDMFNQTKVIAFNQHLFRFLATEECDLFRKFSEP